MEPTINVDSNNLTFVGHKYELESFEEIVKEGLLNKKKYLSCQFLYDEVGSQLFEKITELPEYYVTRCERAILEEHSEEIAKKFSGKDPVIIELGSGSSTKTKLLLDAFFQSKKQVHYVPIDISESILKESAEKLLKQYDNIKITANCGLYQQGISYVASNYSDKSKLILFLGTSIGNFSRSEAVEFLCEIRKLMQPDDRLLIGIDLRKEKSVVEKAYNDSQKVTSSFNLNLLDRINRELGGNFVKEQFEHIAMYQEDEGKINMFLRSLQDQKVHISFFNSDVFFIKGELIHTENSVKYSKLEIDSLAFQSGFSIETMWFDPTHKFSLSLFAPEEN